MYSIGRRAYYYCHLDRAMRNLTEFCKDDFNQATIAYELPDPASLEGDHEAWRRRHPWQVVGYTVDELGYRYSPVTRCSVSCAA